MWILYTGIIIGIFIGGIAGYISGYKAESRETMQKPIYRTSNIHYGQTTYKSDGHTVLRLNRNTCNEISSSQEDYRFFLCQEQLTQK